MTTIAKAYPDILAVDPYNCGCTECIIGEYVNENVWVKNATAADVAAVLSGDVRNNTYSSLFDLVFTSSFSDSSATDFVRRLKVEFENELEAVAKRWDLDEIVNRSY